MNKIAGVIFFFAWLLCGCSIDSIDSFETCAIFFVALLVCIVSAALITGGDE